MKIRPTHAFVCILMCSCAIAQEQASVQGGVSTASDASIASGPTGASATGGVTGNAAASANAADRQADADLAGGTELNATLTRPIDASKSKPGDAVTAKVAQDVKSGGEVVIPRGSTLVGRVIEAKPRGSSRSGNTEGRTGGDGQTATAAGAAEGAASAAADASSRLGIVFDHALLKDGKRVPVDATIQALASASAAASGSVSGVGQVGGHRGGTGQSAGGSLLGGATGSVGAVVGSTGSLAGGIDGTARAVTTTSAGAVGGLNAAGRLASGSRGTFGLKGLDLETTGHAQTTSVITSSTRNVRLDSGTQMLLVSSAKAAQASPHETGERSEATSRGNTR
jgi:hypothetical protein